jgi:anti-sigma B factor antagonist
MENQMPSPQGFAVEVSEAADDAVCITVRGELDMSAAPDLSDAVARARDAASTVVLDLTSVTFLDSSAIGALVTAGREVREGGGRLQIGPRSDIVARVLEITGLAETTEAFDVLPEAG